MERITVTDVRGAFKRAMKAATAAGLDVSRWSLVEGSGSTLYNLNITPYSSLGFGYGGNVLGKTARDAYTALLFMARAWELATEIPRIAAGETRWTDRLTPDDIPADFPVRPLRDHDTATERMTDGTCGLSWDDSIPTQYTPTPAARCPFEHFHN